MKRRLLLAAALAPLFAAGMSWGSGIVGTAHDFSNKGWASQEICKPCHTPHNAIAADVSSRLWNHQLSVATYTLHGASANGELTRLDATRQGGQADMDMASRLCLSCHDGTVALDSFGGRTGSVFMATEEPSANLGSDLSNDHPVGKSVVYAEEAGYSAALGANSHFRYKPIADAKAAGIRFATLNTTRTVTSRTGVPNTVVANEVVSCMSCHNPHENAEGTLGMLLRMDNKGSALCLACHNK